MGERANLNVRGSSEPLSSAPSAPPGLDEGPGTSFGAWCSVCDQGFTYRDSDDLDRHMGRHFGEEARR